MLASITPPDALQGLPEDQANVAIRVSEMRPNDAEASASSNAYFQAAQKDGLFAGLTSALIGCE